MANKLIYKTNNWGHGVELHVRIVRGWDGELPEKGLPEATDFEVTRVTDHSIIKVGHFTLAPLPGCCGVVVSTRSFLEIASRGSAIGPAFHQLKHDVAKLLGYGMMLATTELRNIPEVVGASKAQWKIVKMFRNPRTSNDLGIMVKEIK